MSVNEKILVGVQKPFVLDSTDKFWMILSGTVNVFYARVDDDGNYLSSLKHLCESKKGDLIFGLHTSANTENVRLIVFSNEAVLLSISKEELLNVDHFFLKKMINAWIVTTSEKLCEENPPRVYNSLDKYELISINENVTAFPSYGLNWVHLVKGKISIYGGEKNLNFEEEKIAFPIPVSNKLWIKSLSKGTQIQVLSTREVLEEEINFLVSLEKLQNHFYSRLIKNIENDRLQESEYFERKLAFEEKELHSALSNIRAIVSPDKKDRLTNISNNAAKKNLLYATCKFIGDYSNFDFTEPKHIDSIQNNTSSQLYAIAKSSNVRVRKVILRGNWWKEENGHLLAFTKKENEPVALIQKSPNRYSVVNLSDNSETPVDYTITDLLEPTAYMFFSGFDKKMDSLKSVFRFALNGVRRDAKFLMLAAMVGSLIGLLVPVLSGVVFDDIIPAADRSMHFEIFGIMIVIAIITALLQLVQGALQLRVESKSSVTLQAGVVDYLLRLPVTFFKKYTAGDLTNRVLSINTIRQILSSTLMTAVLTGAFSFVNLILLFYYDSSLAWVGVGLAVIAMLFMIIIGKLKLKHDRHISEWQGKIQGFLFEFLSGITKIRIAGGEKRVFKLWAKRFSKLKELGFKSGSYQNFVEVFNASYPLFTNIFFFSVIYYTFINAKPGATATMITVGSFMAFITAFNKFLSDSLRLSMAFITSLNVIPLYERVKPILEEAPESVKDSIDPGELSGDIEMNAVSFRYNEEQPLILKNITFKIKPGEMVAFVGPSGSGKSTIMRLLLGFEHPETGSIFYDANSYDKMNKELVRRQIGVVLQNGALMSGSIYQNIVGNSELTLDDAWEAARMAGMDEDIKQMPMEMHTVVSEGAGTFSGGQKQRLMIARAIVHKPRLLYMDEATSALDNRTQNIVSESLDKLQATRIVIAHRLSTIKNADRIYVLEKGEIKETGTYEELMGLDGLFTQLAKRQMA